MNAADAADVGCGTGLAARLVAERGVKVLGVEPDERMAHVARRHGIEQQLGGHGGDHVVALRIGRGCAAGAAQVSGGGQELVAPDRAFRLIALLLQRMLL